LLPNYTDFKMKMCHVWCNFTHEKVALVGSAPHVSRLSTEHLTEGMRQTSPLSVDRITFSKALILSAVLSAIQLEQVTPVGKEMMASKVLGSCKVIASA
jgi:hypothetical protein